MNLAFVTIVDLSGHSGQNIYNREIATALATNEQINLSLFCPRPAEDHPTPLVNRVAETMYLRPKHSGSLQWHLLIQLPLYKKLCATHKQQEFDGIVLSVRPTTIAPVVFARRYNVPLVSLVEILITENITRVSSFPGISHIANTIVKFTAQTSRHVFTADKDSADWIRSLQDTDSASVSVFTHPVNTDRFKPQDKITSREQYIPHINNDSFVLGFAGSFRKRHRLESLVRGFATAQKWCDQELHFLFVGDGPLRQEIRQIVRNLGLTDVTTFPGYVPDNDIGGYLAACDILCSVRDKHVTGSPLKLYEYFACARPVLVNDHKELAVAVDIGAGRRTNSLEPSDIADEIIAFVEMKDSERKKMGKKGYQFIEKNDQTWTNFAETIREIFD